jgi:GLPGLI family protein
MKHFTTILFLFLAVNLYAQVEYGTIEYVRVSEMATASVEGVDDKVMSEMMAKLAASGAFTKNFTATFTPEGFTFLQKEKESASVETEMAGGGIVIMEMGDDPITHFHTNTVSGEVTNRDFIFDKGFLVQGKAELLDWTLTGKTVPPSEATVGLDLKIATATTAGGEVLEAGYAPSLPIQVGPANYYGLPGAIITLRVSKGTGKSSTFYRATALTVSSEPLTLVAPTEGKKISQKKFMEERSKREEAMHRRSRSHREISID